MSKYAEVAPEYKDPAFVAQLAETALVACSTCFDERKYPAKQLEVNADGVFECPRHGLHIGGLKKDEYDHNS